MRDAAGKISGTFQNERLWQPELLACRREYEDIERNSRERLRALLTRLSNLLPLVQADETYFRRFCRTEGIARHGRLEIMIARYAMGPLDHATAGRYGKAIRNGRVKELGILRAGKLNLDAGGRNIDNQITNPALPKKIIEYLKPTGRIIDMCRAGGAFHQAMPKGADYAEIREGRDFCDLPGPWDWGITNPPWSVDEYNRVAGHAFCTCENVVFLGTAQMFSTKTRLDFIRETGHALKEIIILPDWKTAGFAERGFWLGVLHWQRGYQGGTIWTYW